MYSMNLRVMLRFVLALWLSAAISVIVPTHLAAHGALLGAQAGSHDGSHERGEPDGPKHDHKGCAVCHLASSLSLEQPVVVSAAPLASTTERLALSAESPAASRPVLPFHDRAPPVA
jgi:hypothetical protein